MGSSSEEGCRANDDGDDDDYSTKCEECRLLEGNYCNSVEIHNVSEEYEYTAEGLCIVHRTVSIVT
jgi:hypothetical protein